MTFTLFAQLLKVLKAWGDIGDEVVKMANDAAAAYPDLASARDQFIRDYAEKWKLELTPERAMERASLIWSELRSGPNKGFDSEGGSSV